ncbi:PPOX class F420-dependent oxidoreductase [Actinopolyspora saharensis]|uniref:Pyridoxamine 5'-phosphate oxidase family protein n=1 Tax=Actinopolyspora saharensis TaxID=995062 RepID=A0A1H1F648_9ACTN|nr:PPOX class F420-dependent oxidoreductase [Actinopolyspora saharensis]SDQ96411.1 pyridoxamine 5'-phosphate oxidase family protein [Actinopolyspora saharensis]
MIFTGVESAYLDGQLLGRLATVGSDGTPQVRPLGFRLNEDGTIDLGGPRVASTQRYRNVRRQPRVGFVVDDLTPEDPSLVRPGMGRGVEIRGVADTLRVDTPPGKPGMAGNDIIRLLPRRVISWHIDPDNPAGEARNVA